MFWGLLGQAEQKERRKRWSCPREEQGTACELGLRGDRGLNSGEKGLENPAERTRTQQALLQR